MSDEIYDEIDRLVAAITSYLHPDANDAQAALAALRSMARTDAGVPSFYEARLDTQTDQLAKLHTQRSEMIDEIDRLQAQVSTLMRLGQEHFPDKL